MKPWGMFAQKFDSHPGSFTMECRNEAKRSSLKLRSLAEGFSWVRAFLGSVLTLRKTLAPGSPRSDDCGFGRPIASPFFSYTASQCHRKGQGATTSLYFRRGRAPFYNACKRLIYRGLLTSASCTHSPNNPFAGAQSQNGLSPALPVRTNLALSQGTTASHGRFRLYRA